MENEHFGHESGENLASAVCGGEANYLKRFSIYISQSGRSGDKLLDQIWLAITGESVWDHRFKIIVKSRLPCMC